MHVIRIPLLSRRTVFCFGANINDEQTMKKTMSENEIREQREEEPHKPIVFRKQTRTISFDRVNHLFPSQFLLFFLENCGHKMDSARDESF